MWCRRREGRAGVEDPYPCSRTRRHRGKHRPRPTAATYYQKQPVFLEMRVGGEETFLTMNYHLLLNKITPLPTPLEPHDHLDLPTLPLLSESDCRQHLGPWVLLACYSMSHRTLPQRPQGWAADGTRSKRDSTVEKKGRRQESARRLRPREGPGPKAPSAACLPATTPSPSSSARRCSRQSWP